VSYIELTVEEAELVFAFRRACDEWPLLTLEDAIDALAEAVAWRLIRERQLLDAELFQLERQEARRAVGGLVAGAASYLATVPEASSVEIVEALGGLWPTDSLNDALKRRPDLFERLPNRPQRRQRAWWRLRPGGAA
jgi:hypothetical protein